MFYVTFYHNYFHGRPYNYIILVSEGRSLGVWGEMHACHVRPFLWWAYLSHYHQKLCSDKSGTKATQSGLTRQKISILIFAF